VRALGTADRNTVSAVATKYQMFVAVEQYSANVEQLDTSIAAASAASARLHATGTHMCEQGLKLLYVWLDSLVIRVTVQKGRPSVPFSIQGFIPSHLKILHTAARLSIRMDLCYLSSARL
jgi:hypothetical protein